MDGDEMLQELRNINGTLLMLVGILTPHKQHQDLTPVRVPRVTPSDAIGVGSVPRGFCHPDDLTAAEVHRDAQWRKASTRPSIDPDDRGPFGYR
jgi:hypothetical protein